MPKLDEAEKVLLLSETEVIHSIEIAPGPASNKNPLYRKVDAVMDDDVATMSLPLEVVRELDLRPLGHRTTHRDGVEMQVEIVGPIWVRMGSLSTYCDAEVYEGPVRIGFAARVDLSGEPIRDYTVFPSK